jgi:hypothetical protein
MRKLIAVGVLVGGLLAGAGAAMAQPAPGQGGIGDPLTLAASGVLIPYITGGGHGTLALIEVASPVYSNSNAHMVFFNATCARVGDSVGIGQTENHIVFQNVNSVLPAGTNGLVVIAGVEADGFTLRPLDYPIHSRVYLFDSADGRSRILNPIIIDTAEFGSNNSGIRGAHLWSPLRTAATFYAPLETAAVKTQLTLVCPRSTIIGLVAKGAVVDDPNTPGDESKPAVSESALGGPTSATSGNLSNLGFPLISPPFKAASVAGDMRARVYDTDEILKRDVRTTCDCLTPDVPVTAISTFYADTAEAADGTYTELEVTVNPDPTKQTGSFAGYRSVFTVGAGLNNFVGGLSTGSRTSIQGNVSDER